MIHDGVVENVSRFLFKKTDFIFFFVIGYRVSPYNRRTRRASSGGGGYITPALTREPAAVARWAMRQSTASTSNFKGIKKKNSFKRHKSGQCQLKGQRVKNVNFRLIGYRDGTNNSCEPNLCQKAFQGMKKVAYKPGPSSKQRSRSSQIMSLNLNVSRASCDTSVMEWII